MMDSQGLDYFAHGVLRHLIVQPHRFVVRGIPLWPSALLSSSSEITSAASPAVMCSGMGRPHFANKAVTFGWDLTGACRHFAWGFTSPRAPALRARSSASPWA